MHFDGNALLTEMLKRSGYSSLSSAVADLTLFVDPKVVAKTNNSNLFRIVRNDSERGNILSYEDTYKRVMACDNTGPKDAFRWAIGSITGTDIQFNHIYSLSSDVRHYTSLANICVTPAFLAKATDTSKDVVSLLKYRVWDIYGYSPDGNAVVRPEGYDNIKWRNFAEPEYPVNLMEKNFRRIMKNKPKNRATIACREIGWLFSNFEPDHTV